MEEYFSGRFLTRFSKSNYSDHHHYEPLDPATEAIVLSMIVLSIIFGIGAVNKICTDSSERGKNVKLILYLLLIVSGGLVGWFYIILWIMGVNICG
jgi:hypothetical protein